MKVEIEASKLAEMELELALMRQRLANKIASCNSRAAERMHICRQLEGLGFRLNIDGKIIRIPQYHQTPACPALGTKPLTPDDK